MEHSSTIGWILNLQTGHVSPQYHVVYDNLFTTVPNSDFGGLIDPHSFNPDHWARLLETGHDRLAFQEFDDDGKPIPLPPLHNDWLTPLEQQHRDHVCAAHQRLVHEQQQRLAQPLTVPEGEQVQRQETITEPATTDVPEGATDISEGATNVPEGALDDDDLSLVDEGNLDVVEEQQASAREPPPAIEVPAPSSPTSRPCWAPKPIDRWSDDPSGWVSYPAMEPTITFAKYNRQSKEHDMRNSQYLMALQWTQLISSLKSNNTKSMQGLLAQHIDPNDDTLEWMHPMVLASKANSEDNPTWEEAMNGPNHNGFMEACKKELHTLKTNKEAWEVVDCEPWMNVLPSTWAFKVKRFPSGLIRKFKARFSTLR